MWLRMWEQRAPISESAAVASVHPVQPWPLWARTLLVHALLRTFQALSALVLCALLGVILGAGWLPHPALLRLGLVCVVALVAVARHAFAPADRFAPPGIEVTAHTEPMLFHLIDDVAGRMKGPRPERVYLIPDVNAYVAEVKDLDGKHGMTRVMAVGLGLLNTDTIAQLRATLAHEFGHLRGGETRLGACICRVRNALTRMQSALGPESPLARLYEAYGRFFQRITNTMGRVQELAADTCSVRVAGREAHVEGLRREAVGAVLFSNFLRHEVTPLLEEGYRPTSLYEGYRRYLWNLQEDGVVARVERALSQERTEPLDTHPALTDRIRFALTIPDAARGHDEPALSRYLLRDPDKIESELTRQMVQGSRGQGVMPRPIAWEQVPGVVHAAKMARVSCMVKRALGIDICRDIGALLRMLGPENRDAAARKIAPAAFATDPPNPEDVRRSVLLEAAAACVATALVEQKGFSFTRALGRTLQVSSPDGRRMDPYELVRDAVFDPRRVGELRARLSGLGLSF